MRARICLVLSTLAVAVSMTAPAHAVHFYRGPGGGCTPKTGETTDRAEPNGPVTATVRMEHNLFRDVATGGPITRVAIGDAVRFTWNSEHCHSADASEGSFTSGFHYPQATPTTPQVVPGFFEYPVLTDTPTLAFTHTFTTAGTFRYACVHHASIGMNGIVIVG